MASIRPAPGHHGAVFEKGVRRTFTRGHIGGATWKRDEHWEVEACVEAPAPARTAELPVVESAPSNDLTFGTEQKLVAFTDDLGDGVRDGLGVERSTYRPDKHRKRKIEPAHAVNDT